MVLINATYKMFSNSFFICFPVFLILMLVKELKKNTLRRKTSPVLYDSLYSLCLLNK